MVDEVGESFVVVEEPFDISLKLRVDVRADVKKWQIVEVRGTLAESDRSGRYLANPRVYAYFDRRGNPLLLLPKSLDGPLTGFAKQDVTEGAGGMISAADAIAPAELDSSPPPRDMTDASPLAWLKTLPDGTQVQIKSKWLAVRDGQWFENGAQDPVPAAWVLEADRLTGMKVIGGPFASATCDLVSFSATVATEEGQRVLESVTGLEEGETAPLPLRFPALGMNNRALAGTPLFSPPYSGMDTLGMLVTTWGVVRSADMDWTVLPYCVLGVDDGSGVAVRVDQLGMYDLPALGSYIRVTGLSDTVCWNGIWVRRIEAKSWDYASDLPAPAGGCPSGPVSGHLIANSALNLPTRVYTAYGSTKITDGWMQSGSTWRAPYTLNGVPGASGEVGLLTAKSPGYASVSKFATPGSTGVDIELTDTSVQQLDLSDPDPGTISCGGQSTVSVRLWDREGMPIPGQTVTFSATNGQVSPTTATTDSDGRCTVTVSPTGEQDIVLTADVIGAQAQTTVKVAKEVLTAWSEVPLDTLGQGATAPVYAKLLLADGVTPMVGKSITFTAISGGTVTSPGTTNSQGIAQATFTRAGTAYPKVIASWTNDCGVLLSAPIGGRVEIFFCMDCTRSMWGTNGDHGAQASVAAFLREMSDRKVHLRVGGVKFNNPLDGGGQDRILLPPDEQSQLRSLQSFTTVDSFIAGWVDNGYTPTGYDYPELQLDALHCAAQDMNAYSTAGLPQRYIVLITDYQYHYAGDGCGCTSFTKSQIISELIATGCRVYISLWDPRDELELQLLRYNDMTVGGGEFDPANDENQGNPLYPLAKLRARILAY